MLDTINITLLELVLYAFPVFVIGITFGCAFNLYVGDKDERH